VKAVVRLTHTLTSAWFGDKVQGKGPVFSRNEKVTFSLHLAPLFRKDKVAFCLTLCPATWGAP